MKVKATRLSAVLEILGHPHDKDNLWRRQALGDLRAATINGHEVLFITGPDDAPHDIPHFGYDYRCFGRVCEHDKPPWGVKRYFGLTLIVEGQFDLATEPLLYQVNDYARIDIVVSRVPTAEARRDLLAIDNPY